MLFPLPWSQFPAFLTSGLFTFFGAIPVAMPFLLDQFRIPSDMFQIYLVLNNLVAWAYTTGAVRLKSDGTPWRPIVHIEDISRAFVATLHAPTDKVYDRAFNVGVPGENFRIREIAEIVRDSVPNSEVSFAPDASPDKRNYRVDCSLIQREVPEFKPQWTVQKGATELYEAYKANGLTLEEFEGKRYKRIDHVRMLIADGIIDDKLRHVDGN